MNGDFVFNKIQKQWFVFEKRVPGIHSLWMKGQVDAAVAALCPAIKLQTITE